MASTGRVIHKMNTRKKASIYSARNIIEMKTNNMTISAGNAFLITLEEYQHALAMNGN